MSENTDRDWQSIETAPHDGSRAWLKLESGFVVSASWRGGFMTSEGADCSCWVADDNSTYPDCWTDGVCWESNADGCMSDQPVSWMPFHEASPGASA